MGEPQSAALLLLLLLLLLLPPPPPPLLPTMFRVRRYRIFLMVSLFFILALYHFANFRQWDTSSTISVDSLKGGFTNSPPPKSPDTGAAETRPQHGSTSQDKAAAELPSVVDATATPVQETQSTSSSSSSTSTSTSDTANTESTDPPLSYSEGWSDEEWERPDVVTQQGQGRLEPPFEMTPRLHWTKLPEHFPVPSQSIIPLPSGKAESIPKIQFQFSAESAAETTARAHKLAAVKEAFMHAWEGYRTKAWRKDELRPASGGSADPFCGWSATLFDSLDTLWIMDMKDEFNEAVATLNGTDFTITARGEIPLFETTIRYLGGLLGAYDISGGTKKILVRKAVELAEVLMGAFDTPNRMPQTFYQWRPTFTTQPHRAGTRVVLSELGSLSVEFTRLAQITGEAKYYDAIARITDALEAWQKDTRLPGMWPTVVDASGCQKRAATSTTTQDSGSAMQPLNAAVPGPEDAEDEDTSAALSEAATLTKADPLHPAGKDGAPDFHASKRQLVDATLSNGTEPLVDSKQGANAAAQVVLETEVDCEPQGLASPPLTSKELFTLGSLSDSLYEYLPKEYMLLGGRKEQYKTMYQSAMDVVKKRLLYRPMTGNESDILLSGGWATVAGNVAAAKLVPEGTHLTCFAGGMLALGAKIFNRPDDLDLGSKLTDGCIWAYESTKTGIMPETFTTIPCDDKDHCPWNETRWFEALDPFGAARISQPPLPELPPAKTEDSPRRPLEGSRARNTKPHSRRAQEDEISVRSTADTPSTPPGTSSGNSIENKGPDATMEQSSPVYTPRPPLSQEEYAKSKIEEGRLPTGMVAIKEREYILRYVIHEWIPVAEGHC